MCSVDNKSCSLCAAAEDGAVCSSEDQLKGFNLSLSSFIVFVLPLLFSLSGVVFAGSNELRQLLGAFTGFFIGVLTAKIFTKRKVSDIG